MLGFPITYAGEYQEGFQQLRARTTFTSFVIVFRRTSMAPVYVPGGEHCMRVLMVSKLANKFFRNNPQMRIIRGCSQAAVSIISQPHTCVQQQPENLIELSRLEIWCLKFKNRPSSNLYESSAKLQRPVNHWATDHFRHLLACRQFGNAQSCRFPSFPQCASRFRSTVREYGKNEV